MGRLRATLKWGFLCVLVLLALLIAAWAVSRAMYPTDEQREAIAEMKQQTEYSGKNAFALLWTLDRDVPEKELDHVMQEDVRRFSTKPPLPNAEEGSIWAFEPSKDEYPDLSPNDRDAAMFCQSRQDDCLARVREDLDAYSALIDRYEALFARIERLQDFDYIRSEFPQRLDAPLPSFQPASLMRTRHAVWFASDRQGEAVAATCRSIATWRRLGAHSDNLIGRLIGAAYATDLHGRVLASMLAEWPVDRPLPEQCRTALASPSLQDASLCEAMRGEFGYMAFAVENVQAYQDWRFFLDRLVFPVVYDPQATLGQSAQALATFCDESKQEEILRDKRLDDTEPEHRSLWHFACLGNPVGCMMNAVTPSYADYRHRLQDYAAKLRVLGTLAWMRRHADEGRSPKELLAARPDALKSPSRDIEFGPEGRSLRVPLYDTRHGEYWSIPLPQALHSKPRT